MRVRVQKTTGPLAGAVLSSRTVPSRVRLRVSVVVLALVAVSGLARADAEGRRLLDEGDALAAHGDRAGALAKYEDAIRADPDVLAGYERATPLWIASDALDAATRFLERGAARHPEWPSVWYSLAYVYRRQHRRAAALAAYDEYVRLRPDDPAPYYGIAVLAEDAGDAAGAVTAYRRYRALERDPGRADFRRQAQRAIARLAPWERRWQAQAIRLLVDGGDVEAWRSAATLTLAR